MPENTAAIPTTEADIEEYNPGLLTDEKDPNILEKMRMDYARLLEELSTCEEEVLFISIGCAFNNKYQSEQQLPTYLQQIAKTRTVRAMLIDINFSDPEEHYTAAFEDTTAFTKVGNNSYVSKHRPGLAIEIFGCAVPEKGIFNKRLEDAICQTLDKGGRVFIANHTQIYDFADISNVADVCNGIKKSHPLAGSYLQLYTQGESRPVRYYLENTSYYSGKGLEYHPPYLCPTIADLANIPQFGPDFLPLSPTESEEKSIAPEENLPEERHELAQSQPPITERTLFTASFVFGCVAAVAGIALCVVAIVCLHALSGGALGLILAGAGLALVLTGTGFFADSLIKHQSIVQDGSSNLGITQS